MLALQFPEWSVEGGGQSFRRSPGGDLTGHWMYGSRRLTIAIHQADSLAHLDFVHRLFQARPMMPLNRELADLGNRAHLFEHSDGVEVGFTWEQALLHVVVTLHLQGLPRAAAAPAPPLEVERALTLTRAIAGAIRAVTVADQGAADIGIVLAREDTPPPAGVPAEARGPGGPLEFVRGRGPRAGSGP